jgi:hypothetical protein
VNRGFGTGELGGQRSLARSRDETNDGMVCVRALDGRRTR